MVHGKGWGYINEPQGIVERAQNIGFYVTGRQWIGVEGLGDRKLEFKLKHLRGRVQGFRITVPELQWFKLRF